MLFTTPVAHAVDTNEEYPTLALGVEARVSITKEGDVNDDGEDVPDDDIE